MGSTTWTLWGKDKQRTQGCVSREEDKDLGGVGEGVNMVKTHGKNAQQTNKKQKIKGELTRCGVECPTPGLQTKANRWGAHTMGSNTMTPRLHRAAVALGQDAQQGTRSRRNSHES